MAALTGKNEEVIVLEATISGLDTTPDYAAGDFMGADLIEFANALGPLAGRSGVIQWVVITDNAKQSANIDLVPFTDNPATDYSSMDNDAFAPGNADLKLALPDISVTDWKEYSANAKGQAMNLGLNFTLAGTSLWLAPVARGTYNGAAATDLTIRIGILGRLTD